MKAYHFIKNDLHLNHDMAHIKTEIGLTLSVDPKRLKLCSYGLHASLDLLDALQYAPGSMLCIVELEGKILEDTDKVVAEKRTILNIVDFDRALHEFALWCAEQALALIPYADPRCQNAIDVKRRWLDQNATDEELEAAWAAARAAAWSAAESGEESAAWSAAWAAARAAARAAVWSAAESAALSAALSAAESAARSAQKAKLLEMLESVVSK